MKRLIVLVATLLIAASCSNAGSDTGTFYGKQNSVSDARETLSKNVDDFAPKNGYEARYGKKAPVVQTAEITYLDVEALDLKVVNELLDVISEKETAQPDTFEYNDYDIEVGNADYDTVEALCSLAADSYACEDDCLVDAFTLSDCLIEAEEADVAYKNVTPLDPSW